MEEPMTQETHTPSRVASRIATGNEGESLAVRYLQHRDFTVLDRNWRCREGELDIVAQDGGTIVAIEVKTRRGLNYGAPLESITYLKARRLRRLLTLWLRDQNQRSRSIRIDGIGVLLREGREPQIQHVEGIA